MLHLIPAPLHRLLYRLADRLRRFWWRVRKPHRRSVGVVAFDGEGRVLLVRHSYGPPVWALPGGAMDRGEEPAAAASREFREELGCVVAGIVALEATTQDESGSRDLYHLFAARIVGDPVPDMREIVAVGYFPPDRLPGDVDRRVPDRVREAAARLGAGS